MTSLVKRVGAMIVIAFGMVSCGGGGGGGGGSGSGTPASTEPNVLAVTVEDIPSSAAYTVNMPYVSVTVCAPGSSTDCKVIDHVLLDTASVGLRILSPALGTSPALPQQTDTSGGDALFECMAFVSGYTWGTVRIADVRLGGLTAASLPIQVIADATPAVPAGCSNQGTAMDAVNRLGANGILGVGPFVDDLGDYYTCPGGTCGLVAVSINRQVVNPVAALPDDNNGVILNMAAVPANGAAIGSGSLILGIGTRSNNALGSAAVFDLDLSGELRTDYGSATNPSVPAFIDSGSNGLFFPNDNGVFFPNYTIPLCASGSHAPGFFCPSTTLNRTANLTAATNGQQSAVALEVANADTLVLTGNKAFNNLAAPWSGIASFDWGMPFFYGRRVYFGIYGRAAPVGATPPYVAF
jgi:hypothetical protein